MLERAIAAYVESLGERELDVPLRALLRAAGFYDIEFVHGVSEHGRDFIAKRGDEDGVLRQYSVQSKAGDLSISKWRNVRQQLDDIRTIPLQHPLYDDQLPPAMMLVTNGALIGDARAGVAGYRKTLPAPWTFEIWTGERLVRLLGQHLEAALAERARGPLLSLLGAIDDGGLDQRELEHHSRRWIPASGAVVEPVDILEASLVANRLQAADRLDLACFAALGILRAQLLSRHGETSLAGERASEVEAAGAFFSVYAEALWERCDDSLLHAPPMVNAHREFGFWVTYPARCMRLAEILGLLGIWRKTVGNDPTDVVQWLERFVAQQPGAAHPVSDRFALSLIPPALLLGGSANRDAIAGWLREAVRWTADRYEGEGLGLAGVDSSPEKEVDYLLGDLEHIELPARAESLVAAVILDVASVLELAGTYNDARHEFLAVEIALDVRIPPAGRDAWLKDGAGVRQQLNPPYVETFDEAGGWQTAPHHRRSGTEFWSSTVGLEWAALAAWSLLRDRWSVPLMRELAAA